MIGVEEWMNEWKMDFAFRGSKRKKGCEVFSFLAFSIIMAGGEWWYRRKKREKEWSQSLFFVWTIMPLLCILAVCCLSEFTFKPSLYCWRVAWEIIPTAIFVSDNCIHLFSLDCLHLWGTNTVYIKLSSLESMYTLYTFTFHGLLAEINQV